MTKNVYIHIPFCQGGKYRGKCNYCSFISFDRLDLKDDYLVALKKQIQAEYKGENLNTLYFGGGTPSLLSVNEIKFLLDLFYFEDDAEITIEVNPDDVNLEYLKNLKTLETNRISIGAQTFDDNLLKILGRRHNSAQIKSAVTGAKKAGFKNISLDLIYGIPEQNIKLFVQDLKQAILLEPQHISLYGLKIEESCYFYQNQPKNLPDLDLQAEMYLKAVEIITKAGFEHYEVSNFALIKEYPNIYTSRHNLNYWDANNYYGFGCAASGHLPPTCPADILPLKGGGNTRYTNESSLEKYIANPFKKISEQILTKQEMLEEAIFLGLRKIAGININEINQKFGIDFNYKYANILEKYSKYFVKTESGYAFTPEGILISNEILSEFIEV